MKKILPIFIIALFLSPILVGAISAEPTTIEPDAAIEKITSLVFGALLAVAVIAIIVAGFMFITAQGDPTKVGTAKAMLMYAVVGIVVALLAQGIVNYLREMFQ